MVSSSSRALAADPGGEEFNDKPTLVTTTSSYGIAQNRAKHMAVMAICLLPVGFIDISVDAQIFRNLKMDDSAPASRVISEIEETAWTSGTRQRKKRERSD